MIIVQLVECLIVAQKVMGSNPINYPHHHVVTLFLGKVAEWSIALVLKTSIFGGSNPSFSVLHSIKYTHHLAYKPVW